MWWKEHPWETTITSRRDTTEESSGYLKSLNRLGTLRKTGMHPTPLERWAEVYKEVYTWSAVFTLVLAGLGAVLFPSTVTIGGCLLLVVLWIIASGLIGVYSALARIEKILSKK